MGYNMAALKEILGSEFDEAANYLIDTHRGADQRIRAGTHKRVGEVQDSTEDQNGTMIVLQILPPPSPPPKPKIEQPKKSTARPVIPASPDPAKLSSKAPPKAQPKRSIFGKSPKGGEE